MKRELHALVCAHGGYCLNFGNLVIRYCLIDGIDAHCCEIQRVEDHYNFKKIHNYDTGVCLDWLRAGCNTGCYVQILSDSLRELLLSWDASSKVRTWCCEMLSTSWEVLIALNFHQSPPCKLSAGETPIDSNERLFLWDCQIRLVILWRFTQAYKRLLAYPNQNEPLRGPPC